MTNKFISVSRGLFSGFTALLGHAYYKEGFQVQGETMKELKEEIVLQFVLMTITDLKKIAIIKQKSREYERKRRAIIGETKIDRLIQHIDWESRTISFKTEFPQLKKKLEFVIPIFKELCPGIKSRNHRSIQMRIQYLEWLRDFDLDAYLANLKKRMDGEPQGVNV